MKCDVSIDHPLVDAERVAKLISKLCTKRTIDTFYVESIVPKTNVWFPNLEDATAVQTAMKYDENMVYYTHKPVFSKLQKQRE